MSKTAAPEGGRPEPAPAPAPPPAYGAASMVDLEAHIAWSACELLNGTSGSSAERCLKQGPRDQADLLVESDADEQLLLTVAFKSRVKLHSLQLDGPADGDRAPRAVKLFINRGTMDFSDAEGLPAEQALELEPEQLGTRLELKFVKFQAVDKLTLFVEANQGDAESSALAGVRLWGAPLGETNMAEFKRVAGEKGEGE